jgi:hypothetical protein
MSNVIKLNIKTTLDISAPDMLRAIADEAPQNAFVISWPADGSAPSYHSSTADIPVVLMRLQEFIHKHFNGDFE